MKSKLEIVRNKLIDPFKATEERGSSGVLFNWVRDLEDGHAPIIDMKRYSDILEVLPDKIVERLEKGRLSHVGKYPMLKMGLGYAELLFPVIVDSTAIASSAAEAKLAPTCVIPKNYMAPNGLPGRTLRLKVSGRGTTLTTLATMTFRNRIATTDIITGAIIHATGPMAAHATAQTNSQWEWRGEIVTRAVGQAGNVHGQGKAELAWDDLTTATQHNKFSGSAGQDTPATQAWDTTLDQFFQITGQWSLATAYSIQTHNYLLEALN